MNSISDATTHVAGAKHRRNKRLADAAEDAKRRSHCGGMNKIQNDTIDTSTSSAAPPPPPSKNYSSSSLKNDSEETYQFEFNTMFHRGYCAYWMVYLPRNDKFISGHIVCTSFRQFNHPNLHLLQQTLLQGARSFFSSDPKVERKMLLGMRSIIHTGECTRGNAQGRINLLF